MKSSTRIRTIFITITLAAALQACTQTKKPTLATVATSTDSVDYKTLSDAEWRQRLTPEQYHILREKGTELPFTADTTIHYKDGTFYCAGCGTALFDASTKYDSGCGWPSFYAPLDKKTLEIRIDNSHGMVREEVLCKECGGHLGHVFDDGPLPTGKRYCMNGTVLNFQPK